MLPGKKKATEVKQLNIKLKLNCFELYFLVISFLTLIPLYKCFFYMLKTGNKAGSLRQETGYKNSLLRFKYTADQLELEFVDSKKNCLALTMWKAGHHSSPSQSHQAVTKARAISSLLESLIIMLITP